MIVENEQVTPVVHRRRTVFPHDAAAQFATHGAPIGFHDTEGRTRFSRCDHRRRDPVLRVVSRQHTQGSMFRAIYSESPITAVREEILQLDGPSGRYPCTAQRLVKFAILSLERMFHEDLPDNVVDERRMDPVSTEITGPRQAAQHL